MNITSIEPSSGIESDRKTSNIRTRSGKSAGEMQFVEFILGHEYFAVNLFQTREVIVSSEITPLPGTPEYIKGVMDLRGSITTIIDLKKLMNQTDDGGAQKRSRIIILDSDEMQKSVGILVDDVYSVSTYRSADIDRNTEDNSQKSGNILGVIRKTIKDGGNESKKLILWLDIQAIRSEVEKFL